MAPISAGQAQNIVEQIWCQHRGVLFLFERVRRKNSRLIPATRPQLGRVCVAFDEHQEAEEGAP